MKKLLMAVAILGMSAAMSFANAQDVHVNGSKAPFVVEFNKLSSYLDLSHSQLDAVYQINDYFVNQQRESLSTNSKRQEARLQTTVYRNLKLMKKVLDTDQYRKYVALINVTNNNNRQIGEVTVSELFLAANDGSF